MKLLNPDNERIKRSYLGHLKDARGFSESTLDKAEEAIHRFESYTKFKDFRIFHIEQAKGFKQHLCDQQNPRTKKPLSHGTVYSMLNALKAFFVWLASQPGFKSRISYTDADYFSPSGAIVPDSFGSALDPFRPVLRNPNLCATVGRCPLGAL
jgi:hypothetical protein